MSVRWYFNWSTWSPTPQQFLQAITYIQLEEKLRLGKFVFRKDVRASLAGRLLIRKYVSENLGVPYHQVKLLRDKNNRPCIENETLLFNVSHQGCYTVLVGERNISSNNLKLGVDIMKLEYTGGKTIPEFFRIMDRNFSIREWMEIKRGTEQEQVEMFCRHWALKESYVKAKGTGLVENLQAIDFATKTKLTREVVRDTVLYLEGKESPWKFEETLIDGHCVAVTLSEELKELGTEFREIFYEDLVIGAEAIEPEDRKYCEEYFDKSERP